MISKLTAVIMAVVTMFSNIMMFIPAKSVEYKDVAYGTEKRQIMDIVFPENIEDSAGVVLYIHGGGWTSGNKSSLYPRAKALSNAVNCIGVSMNYRYTSSAVKCTDILKDIELALKKVKSMAETRGITCEKVMLVGFSAGAHLAMLYAYTQKYKSPIDLCAVVSYSGPADISTNRLYNEGGDVPIERILNALSNLTGKKITKENHSKAKNVLLKISPITYVNEDIVPTLIVHGKQDEIVDIRDIHIFKDKLESVNAEYFYFELDNSGHSLGNDPIIFDKSNKVLLDFAKRYIGADLS